MDDLFSFEGADDLARVWADGLHDRTRATAYLASRSLSVPASPDLLFHDDLTDFDTRRGWPGLVAIIRDQAGEPTGGIHRTFLLDDGSTKAPAAKKMLGPVGSGAVRLSPFPADGHLGIAEGIETALSATALFGQPVWAALSADGLRRWAWPEGVTRITIFADAGDAGRRAAAALADRLTAANIANTIVVPLHGDDFNDDLRKGATARDCEPRLPDDAAAAQVVPPEATPLRTDLASLSIEALTAAVAVLTNPPELEPLAERDCSL